MKYLVPLFLLISSITVYSQSLPVLRIHKTDKSITTIPLQEIDSLVHGSIVPVNLVLLGVKNISTTTALCEARITSKGDGTLLQCGFCWSTSSNPTINSSKVISTSTNNFTNSIYGLNKNTTYFIRAFAYNEAGISYSNQIECITLNKPDAVLETVKIGFQYWTTKNLDISTYRNGDPIRYASSPEEWNDAGNKKEGAWCYYANDPKNGEIYGKLFNWYAVNDARGLAPLGYHIPSDAEWSVLIEYLGGEQIAGYKMKSTNGWYTNGNGDNSSGFNGIPGGYCSNLGVFIYIGVYGNWWSSTEKSAYDAWYRNLYYMDSKFSRSYNYKPYGLSVRCLRD
jgi:uncharacterized protein (TIGR02145 family)